jgi:hypothetical protein
VTFTYWTLTWGGLFDGRPADDVTHLVRQLPSGGTPGPTFCGIDRFAKDGPGGSWHSTPRNPFGEVRPICEACELVEAKEKL